jgi:hypothetical protein
LGAIFLGIFFFYYFLAVYLNVFADREILFEAVQGFSEVRSLHKALPAHHFIFGGLSMFLLCKKSGYLRKDLALVAKEAFDSLLCACCGMQH